MRKPPPFTKFLNYGALLLFVAAVVALCCTQRLPNPSASREPANLPAAK